MMSAESGVTINERTEGRVVLADGVYFLRGSRGEEGPRLNRWASRFNGMEALRAAKKGVKPGNPGTERALVESKLKGSPTSAAIQREIGGDSDTRAILQRNSSTAPAV